MEELEVPTSPLDVNATQMSVGRFDDRRIDLLELFSSLMRRKIFILKITAVCCVAATIASFVLPSRYTATATILPPQETKSAASLMMSQLAGGGLGSLASLAGNSLGIKNPNDLYIGMLKSRTIQDTLIERFELQKIYRDRKISDTRKDLEKRSDIVSDKNGLIRISIEDRDPARAAAIANAYVDELRKVTQHLAVTEASRRRLFFEGEVQQAKDALSAAELALKDTQQRTGMIQLDSQAKAVIEAVGKLRGEIAAKEVQLHTMRSFATEQNPAMVKLEQQLSGMRAQLQKLEQKQPSASADPLLPTDKVPAVALEYLRRMRELKYREAAFEVLAKQFEAAKLDEAKDAAVIQVLDHAVEPDSKSFPKLLLIVPLGTLAGFVGAAFYVLIISSPRLKDPDVHTRLVAAWKATMTWSA